MVTRFKTHEILIFFNREKSAPLHLQNLRMPLSPPRMANPSDKKQTKIQVKYEDMTARYANQVVLTTGQEEVYLDFSSGLIPDQGQGFATLPIHTRIAMTGGGLRRLYQVLGQLLAKAEQPGVTASTDKVK